MTILNMTYGQWNPYQPFHLNAISDLSATPWNWEATITWTDPWNLVVDWQTLATWSSTKLVRKTGSAPSSSSDWTLVVTETVADTYSVSGYTDTGLTNWTTYYYAAFVTSTEWAETISNTESVTPISWWTPNPTRTIFYYDFEDSNDRLVDSSGNNNDATSVTAMTYSQVWNEWVAQTTGRPCGILIDWNLSWSIGTGDFAVSFWMYGVAPWSGNYPAIFNMWNRDDWNWFALFFNPENAYGMGNAILRRISRYDSHTWTIQASTLLDWRHHIVMTRNSGTISCYIDATLDITFTDTSSLPGSNCYWSLISRTDSNDQSFPSWAKGDKFILEKVGWSSQDVTNYFNQTKWDYWIS